MALFESNETKKKKYFLNGMVSVMLADHEIDDNEMELLITRAKQWGLSNRDVKDAITNPQNSTFSGSLDQNERFGFLFDLVGMMLINGEIDSRELKLITRTANSFGYPAQIIEKIIHAIIQGAQKGMAKSSVQSEVDSFLRS